MILCIYWSVILMAIFVIIKLWLTIILIFVFSLNKMSQPIFFVTNNCVGCFDCKSKPIQGIAVNFTILFPCIAIEKIFETEVDPFGYSNRSTNFGRLRIIKEFNLDKI